MPLITDLVNNVLDISTKFCLHQDEHTDEEQFLNMKLKKKRNQVILLHTQLLLQCMHGTDSGYYRETGLSSNCQHRPIHTNLVRMLKL